MLLQQGKKEINEKERGQLDLPSKTRKP